MEIPREFVFMDRAAIGLGSVFLHLKAEVNWYQLFHDLVRDFDVDALEKRQTDAAEAPWGAAAGMIAIACDLCQFFVRLLGTNCSKPLLRGSKVAEWRSYRPQDEESPEMNKLFYGAAVLALAIGVSGQSMAQDSVSPPARPTA